MLRLFEAKPQPKRAGKRGRVARAHQGRLPRMFSVMLHTYEKKNLKGRR